MISNEYEAKKCMLGFSSSLLHIYIYALLLAKHTSIPLCNCSKRLKAPLLSLSFDS